MQESLLLLVNLMTPQLLLTDLMLLAFLLLFSNSFCALCLYFPLHLTFSASIPTILTYLLLLASSLWLASLLMSHVNAGVAVVAGVPVAVQFTGISAAVGVRDISDVHPVVSDCFSAVAFHRISAVVCVPTEAFSICLLLKFEIQQNCTH
jgi:hypothetical protein